MDISFDMAVTHLSLEKGSLAFKRKSFDTLNKFVYADIFCVPCIYYTIVFGQPWQHCYSKRLRLIRVNELSSYYTAVIYTSYDAFAGNYDDDGINNVPDVYNLVIAVLASVGTSCVNSRIYHQFTSWVKLNCLFLPIIQL